MKELSFSSFLFLNKSRNIVENDHVENCVFSEKLTVVMKQGICVLYVAAIFETRA